MIFYEANDREDPDQAAPIGFFSVCKGMKRGYQVNSQPASGEF